MTDIVERLRALSSPMAEILEDGVRLTEFVKLGEEAADEIERLTELDALAKRAMSVISFELATLRATNERLRIENIQMQAALGYGILAEDERHIIPSNPFRCGTCHARAALTQSEEVRG